MGELSILKIGGSVLTDKLSSGTLREDLIRSIGRALVGFWPRPLIIIHGAGSFGHPVAKEYGVSEGYKTPKQLEGFVKTSRVMRWLNNRVVELLCEGGLLALGLPGGILFQTRDGSIESANLEPILAALDIGIIPVTCGDAVFDRKRKFTVLSGDSMAVYLAKRLKAKRLIFAVDVEGVYHREGDEVKLIPELRKGLHVRVRYEDVGDVTGGMASKIDEAFEAVEAGSEVLIVSGMYPERVFDALMGREVKGTRLVA